MSLAPRNGDQVFVQVVERLTQGFGAKSPTVLRAAERLRQAQQDIALFTPAELYQYIDPTGVQTSLEQEQGRSLRWLIPVRNLLFILPLVLTSLALALAISLYQADLSSHPQDINQPFLFLWETGFHGNTFLTVSYLAIVDASLLLAGILVGFLAENLRLRARQRGQQLRSLLDEALKTLSDLSLIQIRELANPNRGQNQALIQVNLALKQSVEITQQVQVQIVQVVQQIGGFQKSTDSLARFTQELSEFISKFEQRLYEVFSSLQNDIGQAFNALDESQRNRLDQLNNAIVRLNTTTESLTALAQTTNNMLTRLDEQGKGTNALMSKVDQSFNGATTALNEIKGDLNKTLSDFIMQAAGLASAVGQIETSTQQLNTSVEALNSSQQKAANDTRNLVQQMSNIAAYTGNSSSALSRITDTQATAIQAVHQVVARLDYNAPRKLSQEHKWSKLE